MALSLIPILAGIRFAVDLYSLRARRFNTSL
jgi:hypothetical protein